MRNIFEFVAVLFMLGLSVLGLVALLVMFGKVCTSLGHMLFGVSSTRQQRLAGAILFSFFGAPLALVLLVVPLLQLFRGIRIAMDPVLYAEILGMVLTAFGGGWGFKYLRDRKQVTHYVPKRARPDDDTDDHWNDMRVADKAQEAAMAESFCVLSGVLDADGDGQVDALTPEFFQNTMPILNNLRTRLRLWLEMKMKARRTVKVKFFLHKSTKKTLMVSQLDEEIKTLKRFIETLTQLLTDCEMFLQVSAIELRAPMASSAFSQQVIRGAQDLIVRAKAFSASMTAIGGVSTDTEQRAYLATVAQEEIDVLIGGVAPLALPAVGPAGNSGNQPTPITSAPSAAAQRPTRSSGSR